ncbi:hypothetical protein HDU79_009174 [Rhizoclosmatium sp. JEL0117]|nr:hypothetical protein HDU79_009174 [Rhizoclosmatium sp. JEL0117]
MAITITASLIRKLSNFFYWHATVMIVLFVSVYIGFYRIGYDQAAVYPTLPAKTGFYIHLHLMYLSMTLVTYLSLIPIVIGGSQFVISSWLIVMLNGPLWMWTLWLSYKAIKRGDVTEHWKMNLRAFGYANAILWMRPIGILLAYPWIPPYQDIPSRVVEAMKGAMWFTTVFEVVIMEVFFVLV